MSQERFHTTAVEPEARILGEVISQRITFRRKGVREARRGWGKASKHMVSAGEWFRSALTGSLGEQTVPQSWSLLEASEAAFYTPSLLYHRLRYAPGRGWGIFPRPWGRALSGLKAFLQRKRTSELLSTNASPYLGVVVQTVRSFGCFSVRL